MNSENRASLTLYNYIVLIAVLCAVVSRLFDLGYDMLWVLLIIDVFFFWRIGLFPTQKPVERQSIDIKQTIAVLQKQSASSKSDTTLPRLTFSRTDNDVLWTMLLLPFSVLVYLGVQTLISVALIVFDNQGLDMALVIWAGFILGLSGLFYLAGKNEIEKDKPLLSTATLLLTPEFIEVTEQGQTTTIAWQDITDIHKKKRPAHKDSYLHIATSTIDIDFYAERLGYKSKDIETVCVSYWQRAGGRNVAMIR